MLPGLICLYLTLVYGDWNTQTVSQVSNISGINLGISPPQLVVKVSHLQTYAQLLLEFNQDMEQAY
jgi:hypothetical protein|tara:strand:+ start:923 stop:1120 length:198 start_codon:yes stop_codon:yes gene_type:complete